MGLLDGYKTGEVVAATGVTNDALQSWLRRGLIFAQDRIEGGGKQGRHRRFSFFSVMQIAVARALLEAGMSDPRAAFMAAAVFAHTGRSMPGMRRRPGTPFPVTDGATFLATTGEQTELWPDLLHRDPVFPRLVSTLHRPKAFVVCDVSLVFEETLRALGEDPDQFMRDAYDGWEPAEGGFVAGPEGGASEASE